MKKILLILIVLFSTSSFSQVESSSIEVELPADFFKEMFRTPSDKYLVAWSGAVKIIVKNQSGKEVQIVGAIKTVEDYLNTELTNLARRQFKYNLNTPLIRITAPDDKSWAGHCGYDPYRNITFKDIGNDKPAGWPSEITSEPWGLNFSKKISKTGYLVNNKTGEKEVVSVFFQASSIYFYHKIKPQNLKGKITRDDDYKACGTLKMHRLGPGHVGFDAENEVKASDFEFQNQLFLGDYQVEYLWEDGTFQILEPHVVYDPFGNPKELAYELKTFVGEISGTLIDEETKKPVKNQKVTLIPVCSESELPEFDTKSDQEGKFEFINIPNGVYNVVTKGAPDTMAGLTKNPNLRLGEIKVKQSSNYDIYVTYHAPGFAHVELVWENAEIRFPDEGDEIQFFDRTAYIQSGGHGENPTGTDGKPLHIPFAMNVSGVGKITNYGAPENNIPRVISIYSLGAYEGTAQFKLKKTEESLNMCEMTQRNDGAVYLDLKFDLLATGGKDRYAEQHTVSCIEDNIISNKDKASIINRSPYPTAFEQITITDADIEKFKNSEDFEKTLSNGKATLKIEFKLSEEEK